MERNKGGVSFLVSFPCVSSCHLRHMFINIGMFKNTHNSLYAYSLMSHCLILLQDYLWVSIFSLVHTPFWFETYRATRKLLNWKVGWWLFVCCGQRWAGAIQKPRTHQRQWLHSFYPCQGQTLEFLRALSRGPHPITYHHESCHFLWPHWSEDEAGNSSMLHPSKVWLGRCCFF